MHMHMFLTVKTSTFLVLFSRSRPTHAFTKLYLNTHPTSISFRGSRLASQSTQQMPEETSKKEAIVHRHLAETNRKRRLIIDDGIESLHVVLDFDHTITSYISPTGERCLECHDMLEHGPYKPTGRRQSFRADIDDIWSDQRDGKLGHISNWWIRFHDAVVCHKLSQDEFREAVSSSNVVLRPGAAKLLSWLRRYNIKTTIVSAGVSTVIEEVLKQNKIELHDRAEIIANVPVWDEPGTIVSFEEPLIHSRNKQDVLQHMGFSFKGSCPGEGLNPYNIVLAGNSIGDALCLGGMHHVHNLSFGFLHEEVKDQTIRSEICSTSFQNNSKGEALCGDVANHLMSEEGSTRLALFLEHFDVVSCGCYSDFTYLMEFLGQIKHRTRVHDK